MRSKPMRYLAIAAMAVVSVAILLDCVPVVAQVYNPEEDLPTPTFVEKALTKLGRGIGNVFTGWMELPLMMKDGVKHNQKLGYLIGVVPVVGTSRAVIRTGTGVYEAATFPVSTKKTKYQPILEPDFIF